MISYVAGDPLDPTRTASVVVFVTRDGDFRFGLAQRARLACPAWFATCRTACLSGSLKIGDVHAYMVRRDVWIVSIVARERIEDPVNGDLLRGGIGRLGVVADELGIRVIAVEDGTELASLGEEASRLLEHIPSVHGEINVRYYKRQLGRKGITATPRPATQPY